MASPSVPEALHSLRAKASATTDSLRALKQHALAQIREQQQHAPAGHTPSGPRRKGEGVHDEQGILSAEPTPTGGARLRITLLAAGFVLGPSGSSVRGIITATGADVGSWSETWQESAGGAAGGGSVARGTKIRTFVVEGKRRAVVHAINIISAAVDRYNELCGGAYSGQAVDRAQVIESVTFFYSPPPRAAVPYAAALRSHDRAANPPARKSLGFPSPPSNKENTAVGAAVAAAALARGGTPSTHRQLHFHQQVLGALPSTPASVQAVAAAEPSRLLSRAGSGLLPSLPEAMSLDMPSPCMGTAGEAAEMEASTPAYRTYSLFSGMGTGGSLFAEGPFGGASGSANGSSFFTSAFEASTPAPTPAAFAAASTGTTVGRSLFTAVDGTLGPAASAGFLAAATPSLMPPGAPLQRQLSTGMDEDALLAATGFPSYSAFAQPSFLQSALLGTPATPASVMTSGPLSHLPVGAAAASSEGQWWPAPGWQQEQQQYPFLSPTLLRTLSGHQGI